MSLYVLRFVNAAKFLCTHNFSVDNTGVLLFSRQKNATKVLKLSQGFFSSVAKRWRWRQTIGCGGNTEPRLLTETCEPITAHLVKILHVGGTVVVLFSPGCSGGN